MGVSKSANYCFASLEKPRGLALLGEVALGKMHELKAAEYIEKLPSGYHSVKGLGATHPDPSASKTMENGTIVPCGDPVSANVEGTSLLYNEYIVYDVSQVNLK